MKLPVVYFSTRKSWPAEHRKERRNACFDASRMYEALQTKMAQLPLCCQPGQHLLCASFSQQTKIPELMTEQYSSSDVQEEHLLLSGQEGSTFYGTSLKSDEIHKL